MYGRLEGSPIFADLWVVEKSWVLRHCCLVMPSRFDVHVECTVVGSCDVDTSGRRRVSEEANAAGSA